MLQKTPETPASALGSSPESEVGAVLAGGRKSGLRRRLVAIVAVVVVALAGLGAWLMSGSGGPSVVYTTQPVTQGDLTVTVTATGTVEPTNQVTISSELSGTVRSVLVDFNDTVKKGEVLARLDTDKLNANLALAQATLAARKADVAQAQATVVETDIALKRAADLAGAQCVVAADARFGQGRQRPRQGGAGRRPGQSRRSPRPTCRIAETNLAKAEITSPIDGVVLSRDVEPGQIVASSLSAPTLFTLAEDLKPCSSRSASTRPTWARSSSGNQRHLHRRGLSRHELPGDDRAGALFAGDGGRRRHLYGGAHRRQFRPAAQAGHDGDRRHHRRDGQGRHPGAQCGAALVAAGACRTHRPAAAPGCSAC